MASGYMQPKDIDGSATASGFEKWIPMVEINIQGLREVQSGGFAQQSSTRMTGGTQLKICAKLIMDKSYPKLMKAQLGGEPVAEIKAAITQQVKGKEEKIAEVELKNVILTKVDAFTTEEKPNPFVYVELMPTEAKFTFTEFDDEKGSKKGDVAATYSAKENKAS
jgi:type VI protein secretion system component Hcp